jgi:hypothetical protein
MPLSLAAAHFSRSGKESIGASAGQSLANFAGEWDRAASFGRRAVTAVVSFWPECRTANREKKTTSGGDEYFYTSSSFDTMFASPARGRWAWRGETGTDFYSFFLNPKRLRLGGGQRCPWR